MDNEKIIEIKDEKSKDLLVPLEEYIKSSIHMGTRVISGDMRKYIYKRRGDGLAIINTEITDKKLREAANFLSNYPPEEVIVCGKREAAWKPLEVFSKATGIRVFTKKYPAGILTNLNLKEFIEPSLIIVVDPWVDKNAINDAEKIKKPVIGLCDSNNQTKGIDIVIPGNNKSTKSIGIIFWILAREYCKSKGLKFDYKIEDFC